MHCHAGEELPGDCFTRHLREFVESYDELDEQTKESELKRLASTPHMG